MSIECSSVGMLTRVKRRKTDHAHIDILRVPRFSCPCLHDPEQITAKIARTVVLDLNDSKLLIDDDHLMFASQKTGVRAGLKSGGRGAFQKGLSQRYDISNDDAYDLLKENHQSKIRSTLGNLTVEHSLPAIRLQWPFVSRNSKSQIAQSPELSD